MISPQLRGPSLGTPLASLSSSQRGPPQKRETAQEMLRRPLPKAPPTVLPLQTRAGCCPGASSRAMVNLPRSAAASTLGPSRALTLAPWGEGTGDRGSRGSMRLCDIGQGRGVNARGRGRALILPLPALRRQKAPAWSALTETQSAAAAPGAQEGVSADVIADLTEYLKRELPRLFTPEGMRIEGRFEDVVEFEDPITRYDSLQGYLFNIAMLRALFSPIFQLHSVYQTGPAELTTRWTMKMYFRLLPWQPELVFTGLSIYGINPATGRFRSHKDIWDSVQDNAYFSREGLLDLLQQCWQLYGSPGAPGSALKFDVLLRSASYEVRQYQGYSALQATTSKGPSSVGQLQGEDVAADLARLQSLAGAANVTLGLPYIWAVEKGVDGRDQVLLRRPLISQEQERPGVQQGSSAEQTGQQPSLIPERPIRTFTSQSIAVRAFSGEPLPERFEAAEAVLRSSILRDGLKPALPAGYYSAARYAGTATLLPALMRNEVWIPLEDFSWSE